LELAVAEAVEERLISDAPVSPAAGAQTQTPPAHAFEPRSPQSRVEVAKPAQDKPKPEAVPAPAKPVPPLADSGIGLAEIRNNWARIRAEVKKHNGLTEAALNSCRTFTLKDGVLILGYQTDLVKKKMETEENLALLRQAIQAVLGAGLNVRCIVVGNKTSIDNEDLDVDGDGIVRTALDLGGKIVYKK
jgi:DNA polymerase-3 subunit gamma/tau